MAAQIVIVWDVSSDYFDVFFIFIFSSAEEDLLSARGIIIQGYVSLIGRENNIINHNIVIRIET